MNILCSLPFVAISAPSMTRERRTRDETPPAPIARLAWPLLAMASMTLIGDGLSASASPRIRAGQRTVSTSSPLSEVRTRGGHLCWGSCCAGFSEAAMTGALIMNANSEESHPMDLDEAQVGRFAQLVLDGLDREYPNKPGNVIADADGVRSPRQMHPAFFGCFDWHSSVHGHWMLVRLLRLYPDHPLASTIRERLDAHFTQDALQKEADYFLEKDNRSFERMYGWAWALRLVAELDSWEDAQGQRWRNNLRPLEAVIVQRAHDYLPKLSWPIRTGVHPDSAFALAQLLDYARSVEDQSLENLVRETALRFYREDQGYQARYEPSGEDFFSPGLNEADLMRRVLSQEDYTAWVHDFLPGLAAGELGNLLSPVDVSDVTDGKIVHLAGLNLSRAWTLQGIAAALPAEESAKTTLEDAAQAHAEAGLGYVFSGHYEGEHWLATFAIYYLTKVGLEPTSD